MGRHIEVACFCESHEDLCFFLPQGYDKNDPTYGSGYYDTPNRSLASSRENSYERDDGTTAYQQGFEEGRRRLLLSQQRAQFGADQTGECSGTTRDRYTRNFMF